MEPIADDIHRIENQRFVADLFEEIHNEASLYSPSSSSRRKGREGGDNNLPAIGSDYRSGYTTTKLSHESVVTVRNEFATEVRSSR